MLERMKKDQVVLEILRAVKKTGLDFDFIFTENRID